MTDEEFRQAVANAITEVLSGSSPAPVVFSRPRIIRDSEHALSEFASPDNPNFIHAWMVSMLRIEPVVVNERTLRATVTYRIESCFQAEDSDLSYQNFVKTTYQVAEKINGTKFDPTIKCTPFTPQLDSPSITNEILTHRSSGELVANFQKFEV